MPRKHEKMKRTQHYITPEQMDKLNFLSEDTGYGISEHLRRAIDVYLQLPHITERVKRMPRQLDLFEDTA